MLFIWKKDLRFKVYFQEAYDFLHQKWHEIEGKQVLRLIGDGGLQCIRHALKGNPLSEWEEKRLNELRKMEKTSKEMAT